MKTHLFTLLVLFSLISVSTNVIAQTTGDYRTRASGNWTDSNVWQFYNGSVWQDAGSAPTSANGEITLQNGHSVTIASDVTADQVIVQAGATLTLNQTITLTLANGSGADLSNAGAIYCYGTISGSGTITNTGTFHIKTSYSNYGTVNCDFANEGNLYAEDSNVYFNGALSNAASATIKSEGSQSGDQTNMIVANGFTNYGTIELVPGFSYRYAALTVTSGTLTNAGTGNINFLTGTSVNTSQLNAEINNQGTITVSSPATTTKNSAAHSNSGTINVNGADWAVSGTSVSFTNTGTVSVQSGRTFSFADPVFNFNNGSVTGSGTLQLTNSTVTFNLAFTNNGTIKLLSYGTVNGDLVNQGTLHLENETFTFNANIDSTSLGTLKVKGSETGNGTTANIANGFVNKGSIVIEYGYSYRNAILNINSDTLVNKGAITTQPGGTNSTVALNGNVDNRGTINLGTPLSIDDTLTCSGNMNCGGYWVSGGGAFVLQAGGTLNMGSPDGIDASDAIGNIQTTTRTFNSSANYVYSGTSAQETGNALPATVRNLTLNNSNGLTITNSITVDTLTLTQGLLTVNANNRLTTTAINGASASRYIVTSGSGELIRSVGASTVEFPIGLSTSYNPISISNSGTVDNYSVKVKGSFDNPPANANSVVNRQWTISEETEGGSNVQISLQWNADEEGSSFNRNSAISIGHFSNSNWEETSATLSGSGPYTATASGFIHFSAFGIGGSGALLPVELTSFAAKFADGNVVLNWQTVTEKNNYGFEIQRTESWEDNSMTNWKKIGFVKGYGNCSKPQNYSFTDTSPVSAPAKYRLKQLDFDGTFEYSQTVEVNWSSPTHFALEQNFPNPFNPETMIEFALPNIEKVTLKIYDLLGKEVAVLIEKELPVGVHCVKFDGSNLPGGLYFYKISAGSYSSTKRFLLLK